MIEEQNERINLLNPENVNEFYKHGNLKGYNELMLAAEYSNLDGFKKLIELGAKVERKNKQKGNVLTISIIHKSNNILEYIFKNEELFEKIELDEEIIDKSSIFYAIESNNIYALELLIEQGANINISSFKDTPLISAIKLKNYKIFEILIDKGADSNISIESTPLFEAIKIGKLNFINLIIKQNVNLNIIDISKHTPLTYAIHLRRFDIVTVLVDNGADVNFQNGMNEIPIISSIILQEDNTFEFLVDKGAYLDYTNEDGYNTLLLAAVNFSNINALYVLLNKNISLGIDMLSTEDLDNISNILEYAVEKGNNSVVRALIDLGANVNIHCIQYNGSNVNILLYQAINRDNVEILTSLIDTKAIFISGNSSTQNLDNCLEYALYKNKDNVTRMLINKANLTLSKAIVYGRNLNIVRILLETEADIDFRNGKGDTFLMLAAKYDRAEVLKLIIKTANINLKNKLGDTALTISIKQSDVACVKILLEALSTFIKQNNISIADTEIDLALNLSNQLINQTANDEDKSNINRMIKDFMN